MNKILLTLTLFAVYCTVAQDIIIGKTNTQDVKENAYKNWYNSGYESYQPSAEILKELSPLFEKNNFKVEVYFGTWCTDSQRELPKLIKLLEKADFDMKNLTLIGVDEDKIVPDVSDKKRQELDITNVPTIIVYQDNKEINRFVEYAQESLEKDILKIFSKAPYKHSYQF